MEPERHVRLHKFNSLRCRRQAYPCTVTVPPVNHEITVAQALIIAQKQGYKIKITTA